MITTLKERMDLDTDIKKLQIEQSAFISTKKLYKNILDNHPIMIQHKKDSLANLDSDIQYYKSLPQEDEFKLEIDKQIYIGRADAGKALRDKIGSVMRDSFGNAQSIGTYQGFDISLHSPYLGKSNFIIRRHYSVTVETGDSELGNIARIANTLDRLDSIRESLVSSINSLTTEFNTATTGINSEWSKSYLLVDKKNRLQELIAKAQEKEDEKNKAMQSDTQHNDFSDVHVDFSDSVDVEYEELDDEMELD